MINQYIEKVADVYKTGKATEHSYRPALKDLLESIEKNIVATNEPKRIECGAPDFILEKKGSIIGYLEAKDINKNLDEVEKSNQFYRYSTSLNNLILTNQLEFRWYVDGEYRMEAKIGRVEVSGKLHFYEEGIEKLNQMLDLFIQQKGEPIKNAKTLAIRIASSAKLINEIVYNAIINEKHQSTTLTDQLIGFRKVLIDDLSEEDFSDMYAQTICYGLFSSRVNTNNEITFTRRESIYHIPKTNPFLRNLFSHIAGAELDDRIAWLVDDLADVLDKVDMNKILKNFGSTTKQKDPILYFYETFLKEYNSDLRDRRGVYYTPSPVVNYIVKSVDYLVENKFRISDGLANASLVDTKDITGRKIKTPNVQVLDPAVGTGTFLHAVIDLIHERFNGNEGMWNDYVKKYLLERIHGFEILMAPYTIAHMSLGLRLKELGFDFSENGKRLKIYLTNTIDEPKDLGGFTLFSHWLAEESNMANEVKGTAPIMVVLGNPPYSNFGRMNNNVWINELLKEYKKDLNERKTNLNDDYIKFIRFGQWKIEQTGKGILAYITNNSFTSGLTHRQMRKSLMETFDEIYVLNLHGDISEQSLTGMEGDQNVFDIMRGVSITFFVKNSKKKKENLAKLYYKDLIGNREDKYEYLNERTLKDTEWIKFEPKAPTYYFLPISDEHAVEYESFWSINDIFRFNNSGIQTKKDKLSIHFTEEELLETLEKIQSYPIEKLRAELELGEDTSGWKLESVVKDIKPRDGNIVDFVYRPFDIRKSYFTSRSNGFLGRPRSNITSQFLEENIGIATVRQIVGVSDECEILVTENMLTDRAIKSRNGTPYVFPLYIYHTEEGELLEEDSKVREHNFNFNFLIDFEDKIGLALTEENGDLENTFDPKHVMYYIYGITNSNIYRNRYKEYIKKDFPRIPLTENVDLFKKVVRLGEQLVDLHLMKKTVKVDARFPVTGSDVISKFNFKSTDNEHGQIWINDTQYFNKIKEEVWLYQMGGYQVLSQYLKERRNRHMSYEEKVYFMRLISTLNETIHVINELDEIIKQDGDFLII